MSKDHSFELESWPLKTNLFTSTHFSRTTKNTCLKIRAWNSTKIILLCLKVCSLFPNTTINNGTRFVRDKS